MNTKESIWYKHSSALIRSVLRLLHHWDFILESFLVLSILAGLTWYGHRTTSQEEQRIRDSVIYAAEQYIGCAEEDRSHSIIIDCYNRQDTLPRNYAMTYEDNWCAAFGTVAAMDAGVTDIIPAECSCQQQILLFDAIESWQEDECYLPRTGDYIYYVWDEWRKGDCTAWASHVGIVVDTFGPIIKVIEGNKDDMVDYRYIFLNDICIRGFGLPDYRSLTQ